MDYKIFIPLAGQKNKPNSNPNKPNLQKAKMNISSLITKDYRKKDDFEVRINKPNLVRRRRIAKMNANAFSQKDYENKPPRPTRKNKPNSNPIQTLSCLPSVALAKVGAQPALSVAEWVEWANFLPP